MAAESDAIVPGQVIPFQALDCERQIFSRTTPPMLLRDLSFAWRTLRRSPAFTIASVATIALGVGASTAIFSVANAVLLRPLPYANPDRLVLAGAELRKRDIKDGVFSDANFFDFRNVAKTMFEGFATVYTGRTTRESASSLAFATRN
jgi:hypothetical protein